MQLCAEFQQIASRSRVSGNTVADHPPVKAELNAK
jgi:hypothetical protein